MVFSTFFFKHGKAWSRGKFNENSISMKASTLPVNSSVLRIHNPSVISNADFKPYSYLDAIDEKKLSQMLAEGVKQFTSEKDLKRAWLEILTNYQKGDKIAIKPNFNYINHGYKHTITSPQLINTVVSHLVEQVNVRPEEIYIYDLCKKIHAKIVRDRINYPINYIERLDGRSLSDKIRLRLYYGLASPDLNVPIEMRETIRDKDGKSVTCYIPKVVSQAEHIINMPLLTNHIFISNSGALKNHYGTVRFSNLNLYPEVLHGQVLNKSVVDLNRNLHIRNKTKIIVADGLFGVFDRGDDMEGGGKKPWRIINNDFPKSIFISKDPVAIDSVMASYVIQERKARKLDALSAEYLYDAMNNGLGQCEINENDLRFKKINYSTMVL